MITNTAVGRAHAGETDVLISGSSYKRKPVGILFAHSVEAGNGAVDWMKNPVRQPIYQTLTSAGYTIFQADLGGSSTWGNDVAMSRMDEAYNYLRSTVGYGAKIVVFGLSMGGLNSLNWAYRNSGKISGVVTIISVINLTEVYENGPYGAIIDAAYGGSYSESEYGAERNPLTMAKLGKFNSIKIRNYYAVDDTLCKASDAIEFGQYAKGSTVLPFAGDHSSIPPQSDLDEIIEFIESL